MRKIFRIKIKNFKAFQQEQVFDLKGKHVRLVLPAGLLHTATGQSQSSAHGQKLRRRSQAVHGPMVVASGKSV